MLDTYWIPLYIETFRSSSLNCFLLRCRQPALPHMNREVKSGDQNKHAWVQEFNVLWRWNLSSRRSTDSTSVLQERHGHETMYNAYLTTSPSSSVAFECSVSIWLSADICDSLFNAVDGIGLFVGDLNAKFLFNRHHYLNGIQAV